MFIFQNYEKKLMSKNWKNSHEFSKINKFIENEQLLLFSFLSFFKYFSAIIIMQD